MEAEGIHGHPHTWLDLIVPVFEKEKPNKRFSTVAGR